MWQPEQIQVYVFSVPKRVKRELFLRVRRSELQLPELSLLDLSWVMGHADTIAVAEGMKYADLLGYAPTSRPRDGIVRYLPSEGKLWFCYQAKKQWMWHRQTKKVGLYFNGFQ